jgi:co-chaperonin GroES (HSP10)
MSQIAVSVETGEKVLFRKYGGDKIVEGGSKRRRGGVVAAV